MATNVATALNPVTMPRIIRIVSKLCSKSRCIFSLHSGLEPLSIWHDGIPSKICSGSLCWWNPQQSNFFKLEQSERKPRSNKRFASFRLTNLVSDVDYHHCWGISDCVSFYRNYQRFDQRTNFSVEWRERKEQRRRSLSKPSEVRRLVKLRRRRKRNRCQSNDDDD